MNTNDLAVATVTWARTASEEVLLGRSLEHLARAGFRVAVADRGTSAAFAERLTRFPGFHVTTPRAPGLVSQVKASFELAAGFGTPFVLYAEPDKQLFFEHDVTEFVRCASDRAGVGVVLASRSDESFRTFPPVQRYTEGVINHLCGEAVGCPGDYSYGPFLMNRALLPSIANADDRLEWGWRHFTFVTARRLGLRIQHIVGNYPCPPDQRREEDRDRTHRLRQLSQNILGLIGCPT